MEGFAGAGDLHRVKGGELKQEKAQRRGEVIEGSEDILGLAVSLDGSREI